MESSHPTIRLFAMDVDGTLTDGRITLRSDGEESKTFHARDGAAIRLLGPLGIMTAIVSGRVSDVTAARAQELGIDEVHQGVGDKAEALLKLCEYVGLAPEEAAFVGDDLSDLPAMRIAGYSAAPADAPAVVREHADFTTTARGGHGAVREAIEDLLQRQGRWQELLDHLVEEPA